MEYPVELNIINPIPFCCWQEYHTAKNKINQYLEQHYISNSLDKRENSELIQLRIRIKDFEIKNKIV